MKKILLSLLYVGIVTSSAHAMDVTPVEKIPVNTYQTARNASWSILKIGAGLYILKNSIPPAIGFAALTVASGLANSIPEPIHIAGIDLTATTLITTNALLTCIPLAVSYLAYKHLVKNGVQGLVQLQLPTAIQAETAVPNQN